MRFTPSGRLVVASVALLVMGFALGGFMRVGLNQEADLALLTGGATLLVLAARRGDDA